MRPVILLIAPASAKGERGPRAGDLFDTAFIEAVRTLSPQESDLVLLAPWTADLAPLVMAASLDAAPGFDPEDRRGVALPPRGIVPYLLPGHYAPDPAGDLFWQASFVSLTGGGRKSFEAALLDHLPTHVLVLGAPLRPPAFRRALRGLTLKVLHFGSMIEKDEVATMLGVTRDSIIDLEKRDQPTVEGDADLAPETISERSREERLEPFIPFGVLLQVFFDEWLSDDPRTVGHEPG